MSEVSIIILTYNSARYIDPLLNSLKDYSKDFEIIVVDNDSKDETVKIAKKFGFVKVFQTGKNLGFAKGINYGAERAKAKYLLFINPDAVFEKGNLYEMIKLFEKFENVGIVGGKMISHNGESEKSAGKFFNFFQTLLIVLGLDEKLGVRFSPENVNKVDFVSGGFMMVKSSVFKEIGGFDENFFMYVEDMELCYTAKKLGYETYFTPDVVISHKGQGSSNKSFAILNIYKGIVYFFKKHKNIFQYYIVKFSLSLKAIAVYLLGVVTNNNNYKNTYKEAFLAINK